MNKFKDIFKTEHPLIGMVHLAPLLGLEKAPTIEENLKNAITDAITLEKAGYDAIIIENNYDLPHTIFVNPNVSTSFTYIADKVKKAVSIPVGICVLWNDFYTALSIAKLIDAKFVRVPVFVDDVQTAYGRVTGTPDKVTEFRKKINAEDILIFTDIQVKHSQLLNVRPIAESASEAIEKGADGLIITGKWTGDAPKTEDLENVKKVSGKTPILIGSGADTSNLPLLTKYADSIIVGTAIKEGATLSQEQHVNLTTADQRISLDKAQNFEAKYTEALAS